MKSLLAFLLLSLIAAATPFISFSPNESSVETGDFPGWPKTFEGRKIEKMPLTKLEKQFAKNFPGKLARFSDGKREIIMRWVTTHTRKLHPAVDCFKGAGYEIEHLPAHRDRKNRTWGCFKAEKNEAIFVTEQIFDYEQNSWSDVSSWYWDALFGKTTGPWWAVTVAETRTFPE